MPLCCCAVCMVHSMCKEVSPLPPTQGSPSGLGKRRSLEFVWSLTEKKFGVCSEVSLSLGWKNQEAFETPLLRGVLALSVCVCVCVVWVFGLVVVWVFGLVAGFFCLFCACVCVAVPGASQFCFPGGSRSAFRSGRSVGKTSQNKTFDGTLVLATKNKIFPVCLMSLR